MEQSVDDVVVGLIVSLVDTCMSDVSVVSVILVLVFSGRHTVRDNGVDR